jgi:hypothetical protein
MAQSTIYLKYQCLSLRPYWDPSTPFPASECVPPPGNQRGGHTRLRVRGPQFGRLGKKPCTLPTLWMLVCESWRCYFSRIFALVQFRFIDYKLSKYRWKCKILWRCSEKPIICTQKTLYPAADWQKSYVSGPSPCPNNEHFFSSEEPVLWIWIQVNLSRIQIRAWVLNVYCSNTDA